MASGNGLPARVHYENAHIVSAHSDFSRAVVHSANHAIPPPIKAGTLLQNQKYRIY